MAKSTTKAAVKKKPAKTQVRAAAPAKAPKKTAAAKAMSKPAKAKAAKPVVAKPVVAKAVATKAAAFKTPVVVAPEVKPVAKPRSQEKAELLKLPAARQAEATAQAAETVAPKPAPVVRKISEPAGARADLPPADGFTLLVDGHFKNRFGDLVGAKAAASELKTKFPMLRIEIYDGANKARLPA